MYIKTKFNPNSNFRNNLNFSSETLIFVITFVHMYSRVLNNRPPSRLLIFIPTPPPHPHPPKLPKPSLASKIDKPKTLRILQ